ncbi:MAG: alkaline phosphatase family protein, partial [Mycobacterium sp.]
SAEAEDSDDAEYAVAAAELSAEAEPAPAEVVTIAAVDSMDVLPAASSTAESSTVSVSTPPVPAPTTTLVNVESAVVSTGLHPPAAPGPEVPGQAPVMLAALAAARDELERNARRSNANAVTPSVLSVAVDPSPNVLVIGVDGTNLSRVLDDPTNANFFKLIQDGTTAPSSIAGHTTISGPSWSSILTGTWGETTGVINNVFTPWTYDTWATAFNQLETFNPGIQTTSIANWDVISAISGAGSIPADTIINISQVPGDTDWLLTDDAVGDATEAAITAADSAVPNFLLSYFVGVDENGHLYGGDSPQYAAAINNFDRNLGEILQAVADWEALTGEQWTILMTTDHGHQPQKGFGHGFQSPDETSTFVVAENPDLFAVGAINLKYQIVDVTPTVVTLFGGTPAAGSDGVPLTDLSDGNVFPVNDDEALRGSLQDAIDMYGYPDIGTQLSLGLRTIFATGPYIVFGLTNDLTAALQEIVDQDIFLISLLARLAIAPVQLIGDLAYVATNTGAQIVAALTGVTGASIFPLWPPAPPSFPSTPEEATVPDALLACGDAGSSDLLWCGGPSIAV